MHPVQLGDHPVKGLLEEDRVVVAHVDLQRAMDEPGRVSSTLAGNPHTGLPDRSGSRQTSGVLDRFELASAQRDHLQTDRAEILGSGQYPADVFSLQRKVDPGRFCVDKSLLGVLGECLRVCRHEPHSSRRGQYAHHTVAARIQVGLGLHRPRFPSLVSIGASCQKSPV